ncbi:MAG: hypothetical protein HOM14_04005 [Gammaproteobacteria bacterium]|jgi:hypothetical protein|nr:hypothetical protein [Gammaproteobacteria bacterium]MBT3722587.1 hypothetical protein [Gammaproteobacteria bacterium]MBT4077907.1 hypothetical protein [Gammaproteobacteria bacterium]MBT4193207.1 hypothetical protein [Gammaproteobacteria bacterium]MBT4451082.1 hypothetical protein [Gammaproteobacteria bacterium]
MLKTLIIQSHKNPLPYNWLKRCLQSVKTWALKNNYEYKFLGDEIFNRVPTKILQKTQHQKVIATDLARLLALQYYLKQGYETVIWCDADFLIFDPDNFKIPDTNYAIGREVWIQHNKDNQLKVYKKVHNAFLMFSQGNSFLDFYTETAEKLLTMNSGKMPDQFIGPKLLTALHNIAICPVLETAGMLSPLVIKDIIGNQSKPINLFILNSSEPLSAANLCSSSCSKNDISEVEMEKVIEKLLHNPFIFHH